ncbi:hypothetical protein B9Z55_023757 [Caenorhabditis nigoni]|uniref:RSE1/DDB1/CPSF1 second beta-propeller domain-containing protein n=1 Tax=Caenorhabditis nigoni TaxID=1611254 RepID=A0A2G5SR43_9PELO|nr:hypothetical protein B9Z55_023757 [Caenorhabditis nigoni]
MSASSCDYGDFFKNHPPVLLFTKGQIIEVFDVTIRELKPLIRIEKQADVLSAKFVTNKDTGTTYIVSLDTTGTMDLHSWVDGVVHIEHLYDHSNQSSDNNKYFLHVNKNQIIWADNKGNVQLWSLAKILETSSFSPTHLINVIDAKLTRPFRPTLFFNKNTTTNWLQLDMAPGKNSSVSARGEIGEKFNGCLSDEDDDYTTCIWSDCGVSFHSLTNYNVVTKINDEHNFVMGIIFENGADYTLFLMAKNDGTLATLEHSLETPGKVTIVTKGSPPSCMEKLSNDTIIVGSTTGVLTLYSCEKVNDKPVRLMVLWTFDLSVPRGAYNDLKILSKETMAERGSLKVQSHCRNQSNICAKGIQAFFLKLNSSSQQNSLALLSSTSQTLTYRIRPGRFLEQIDHHEFSKEQTLAAANMFNGELICQITPSHIRMVSFNVSTGLWFLHFNRPIFDSEKEKLDSDASAIIHPNMGIIIFSHKKTIYRTQIVLQNNVAAVLETSKHNMHQEVQYLSWINEYNTSCPTHFLIDLNGEEFWKLPINMSSRSKIVINDENLLSFTSRREKSSIVCSSNQSKNEISKGQESLEHGSKTRCQKHNDSSNELNDILTKPDVKYEKLSKVKQLENRIPEM